MLAAIIAARAAGLCESYENDSLRLVLSFTFYTLVSLGTLFLIGRSFLTSGSPGLLLLECGVVLWSLAGTVGDLVDHGDANINVTIFNTGILLAGLCHLAGAILSLMAAATAPRKAPVAGGGLRAGPGRAGVGHAGRRWPTGCRSSSFRARVARRCATACSSRPSPCSCSPPSCCTPASAAARPPFTSWYSLALLLLAVGLFGIMIQLSLWSVVNWLSRTAQWLGGFYLLLAAIAALARVQSAASSLGRKVASGALPRRHGPGDGARRGCPAAGVPLGAGHARALCRLLSCRDARRPLRGPAGGPAGDGPLGDTRRLLLDRADGPVRHRATGRLAEPADLSAVRRNDRLDHRGPASRRARASAAETQALLGRRTRGGRGSAAGEPGKAGGGFGRHDRRRLHFRCRGAIHRLQRRLRHLPSVHEQGQVRKAFAEYPDIFDVYLADGQLAPLDQWAVPRALRGETVTNAEYTLRRKDTGETWVGSYSFAPIRDKDAHIVGSVVVARDVTARKRAEEALRQLNAGLTTANEELRASRAAVLNLMEDAIAARQQTEQAGAALQTTLQRFYAILSNMYSAILLVTDEGRVEFANHAFCDRFGLDDAPADLVGLGAADMIEKAKKAYLHPDEAVARIHEILDRGQPVKGEEVAMRDGGACLRDFVPLNVQGRSYGRLWHHFDISDRKQAEEALQKAAEELARSNKDLDQFASVASHDLQEPLRTVAGFVQLLRKEYGDRLDAKADSYIGYTVNGVKRMQALIHDLLVYARVGTRSREPVPIDAGTALGQALDNLHESIQAAGAEITHGKLPTVRADLVAVGPTVSEPAGQCDEVPQPSAAEDSRQRLPGGRLLAILSTRQRHRHRRQVPGANLRGISTPAHPQTVHRHGHRPGDLQKDRQPPRRPHLGGIGTGTGSHLPLYDSDMRKRCARPTPKPGYNVAYLGRDGGRVQTLAIHPLAVPSTQPFLRTPKIPPLE